MGGLQDLIQLLSTKEFPQGFLSSKPLPILTAEPTFLPGELGSHRQWSLSMSLNVYTYSLPPLGDEQFAFSKGLFTKSCIFTSSE